MRHGEYGYDAPYALVMFGLLAVSSGIWVGNGLAGRADSAAMPVTFYFVFFLANTSSFLYTTRRGKFLEWDRILDRLHLRGDERVLDMGCGRGAVLTAVARRLTTGRVTGVDIWSTKDQSGNARDVTLRNASLEGVGDRVQIETGRHAARFRIPMGPSISWSRASLSTTSDRMPIANERSSKASVSLNPEAGW